MSEERYKSLGQFQMHKKKLKQLEIKTQSHLDSIKEMLDINDVDSVFDLEFKEVKVLIEELVRVQNEAKLVKEKIHSLDSTYHFSEEFDS